MANPSTEKCAKPDDLERAQQLSRILGPTTDLTKYFKNFEVPHLADKIANETTAILLHLQSSPEATSNQRDDSIVIGKNIVKVMQKVGQLSILAGNNKIDGAKFLKALTPLFEAKKVYLQRLNKIRSKAYLDLMNVKKSCPGLNDSTSAKPTDDMKQSDKVMLWSQIINPNDSSQESLRLRSTWSDLEKNLEPFDSAPTEEVTKMNYPSVPSSQMSSCKKMLAQLDSCELAACENTYDAFGTKMRRLFGVYKDKDQKCRYFEKDELETSKHKDKKDMFTIANIEAEATTASISCLIAKNEIQALRDYLNLKIHGGEVILFGCFIPAPGVSVSDSETNCKIKQNGKIFSDFPSYGEIKGICTKK